VDVAVPIFTVPPIPSLAEEGPPITTTFPPLLTSAAPAAMLTSPPSAPVPAVCKTLPPGPLDTEVAPTDKIMLPAAFADDPELTMISPDFEVEDDPVDTNTLPDLPEVGAEANESVPLDPVLEPLLPDTSAADPPSPDTELPPEIVTDPAEDVELLPEYMSKDPPTPFP